MKIIIEVSGGVVNTVYGDLEAIKAMVDISLVDHDCYEQEENKEMEAKAKELNRQIIKGEIKEVCID